MLSKHSTAWRLFFIVMAGLICASAIAEENSPRRHRKDDSVETESEDIWKEVSFTSKEEQRLTEKQIQEILDELKKSNPQRAAQLEELKNTDTEKFIAAIRDEVKKQQKPAQKSSQEDWKEQLHRRHEYFLTWFEEQYPEEHKELNQLQQSDPEKFVQRVMDLMNIYGPIQRAERYSPELAAAMKKDLELQKRRDALLLQIRIAPEDQQAKLIEELRNVVAERFDTIVLEKQLRYEWLKRRLESLKEKLEARASELESLNENKDQSVKDRTDELIERTEKVDWE